MEDKHISYWVKSAENDWEVLLYLLKGKKYVYALFFWHLYLEKLCKALWVKQNKEGIRQRFIILFEFWRWRMLDLMIVIWSFWGFLTNTGLKADTLIILII